LSIGFWHDAHARVQPNPEPTHVGGAAGSSGQDEERVQLSSPGSNIIDVDGHEEEWGGLIDGQYSRWGEREIVDSNEIELTLEI
jgi:hypothetical protein